ncbi:MAG TPA: hypothetical protein VFQ41_12685 [Candidatus Angelobacter sp.]|nr:hypothetical protein [Candidatus Angelobacter sp.]
MKLLITRFLRSAVLGMMLLLSGMASMVCFSYDADNDESTPPVTVEFNGVVPSKKGIQISRPRSSVVAHHVLGAEPPAVDFAGSVALSMVSAPALVQASPQLVVPLRR